MRESSFSSQNEGNVSTKDFVKIETVTSDCCVEALYSNLHQREQPVMNFNERSDSKIETKIEVKEEQLWVEETQSIYYDFKGGTELHLQCIKSPRLKKVGVCSYTSDLFFNEDIGNDRSFNKRINTTECKTTRECQSQKNDVISSIETGTTDSGNVTSCLKHNDLFQQSNTDEHDISKSILNNKYTKEYKCEICQNSFEYWFHLESHRLVHDSKEVNKCDVCDKGFAQLQNLKRHKLIHEGIKPHKCNICSKAFTQMQHLKTHTLIHEGLKPHKCNICSKAFTQIQHLKKHKLIHEGIKPQKCNICNKAFTDLWGLKTHKLIHAGIRPHKCNICNKAFTELSGLKRHKFVHEGIKPYRCDFCNKAFADSSGLKKHKVIHEDIKPYRCNICNKAFTRLQDLKRHKLIHEGIKPHKCNICNKAFIQLSDLKRHKFIHEEKSSK